MTDTELEKHGPNNEEDLPVVLLHGTSGQSEDWSQVVERLTSHCPVIRLNYAEPVIGADSADAPAIPAVVVFRPFAFPRSGTTKVPLSGYKESVSFRI